MYNNKTKSSFDPSITVTPIKVEINMSHSYPTPSNIGSSVAVAATTSARRLPTNSLATNVQNSATAFAALATTIALPAATIATTGTTPKEKSSRSRSSAVARKPPPTIDTFWPSLLAEVRTIQQVDAKHQALPLARIKKIMKLDENAKMIAAEAPLLFAKACEFFIQELTMRAWIHTEESKRRTLQRSDIAQAIANYDQFDFLIDIVPREDIKPTPTSHKKESHASSSNSNTAASSCSTTTTIPTATIINPGSNVDIKMDPEIIQYGAIAQDSTAIAIGQGVATSAQQGGQAQSMQPQQLQIIQQTSAGAQPMQYFISIPGVGQQAGTPQIVQQLHMPQQQLTNGLTPQLTSLNLVATHQQPQQLILTAGPNGQLTATPASTTTQQALAAAAAAAAQQQQQQQQQIQILQQVVTPSGEVANVPITINANQLNLLRLQMQQQQQPQQQVLIPTQCITAQPLLQLGAVNTAPTATPTAAHAQHQQQHTHAQLHQQQQHNTATATNNNIYLNVSQATTHPTHSSNSVVASDRNLGSTFRPNC